MVAIPQGRGQQHQFQGDGQHGQLCSPASAQDYPFHQVFRDTELAASRAAYEAGLSPEVIYTEPGVMVVRFIEARTYGEADVRANVEACLDMVKRCHRDMGKRRSRSGRFLLGVPDAARLCPARCTTAKHRAGRRTFGAGWR